VPLPPGIETVTVNFGPFPDFQGNLLDGTVTFTPVASVPVIHIPTGTPIVKRPITVPFTGATGSVGSLTLPATNATNLTVRDFAYQVAVTFNQRDAEQWPPRTVQLPKEVPTVDLDVLPTVTTTTGIVVATPAITSPTIRRLIVLTQTEYDALTTAAQDDPTILYVIPGA
jgi:hypothetical protein